MKFLQTLRRNLHEWVGSDSFSHPAINGLDLKLDKHLPREGGYFIEAGANDGFTQSNTYYLERFRGWRGMLIEAIPELYEKARLCRPKSKVFNCALVPHSQNNTTVEMIYGNLMSVVVGAMGSPEDDFEHIQKAKVHDPSAGSYRIQVIGRSLSSLLDEVNVTKIDLLSLDVEGFEAQVLKGVDFSRHRPTYLCIEARNREAVEAEIFRHYTLVEELSEMDVLYKVRN